MIDPMVSLAFALHSNKGAYALLLGSGISRASGIPTGWEVVLDLIRKVATIEGADCEPDPAEWYRAKHGSEANYSRLIDEIAKTPAERQRLLRGYFEPTEEERSEGIKLPTPAHKAIAKLAASGYLRVIITTNFDRLMEMALEEVGVAPTVISTSDQLAGAFPLAHAGITLIKLHGDYLDTRIKNTETELGEYGQALDTLLDRILDEYGLIVSGWSGDWDVALRAAIERCPSRRFTTFWGMRTALSLKGKELADRRQAVVLPAKDANHLFATILEKVQALSDLAAPHPLSAKIAIATVKRYLVDDAAKIRLHDLVHEETEKVFIAISDPSFGGSAHRETKEELLGRVEKYGAFCDIHLSMMVAGCYWGGESATKLWVSSLQRIANPPDRGGLVYLVHLRHYPALLLLYGGGIAAIAAGNYQALAGVFLKPKVTNYQGNVPLCAAVYPHSVMTQAVGQLLPGLDRRHTPVSDYLFDKLRDTFREYLPRDEDYQDAFDRFEFILGMVHADLTRSQRGEGWWGPVGCFRWRGSSSNQENSISKAIDIEIDTEGADWPPIKGGLFGGSATQAKTAKQNFDTFLRSVPFY